MEKKTSSGGILIRVSGTGRKHSKPKIATTFKVKTILAFWLLIVPFVAFGQSRKCPPRDDSGKSPGLQSFVRELKTVIENRDAQKLLGLLHPRVQFDFDSGVGIENFRKKWRPEDNTSEVWAIMNKVVRLGGVFVKDRRDPFFDFVFPYVNEVELDDGDEYFNTVVVTGKDVNVREKPDVNSKVVAKLTYDVVHYDYEKSQMNAWYFVQTGDKNISGYVNTDFVYSPVDYRMFLTKETGKWMISCLIAGD